MSELAMAGELGDGWRMAMTEIEQRRQGRKRKLNIIHGQGTDTNKKHGDMDEGLGMDGQGGILCMRYSFSYIVCPPLSHSLF